MDHLPIFLNLKGRRALVLGGGLAAARKTELLLRAGCGVTVIAPELMEDFARLEGQKEIDHRPGPVTTEDLAGCSIAYGAAEDAAANERLHALATEAGVLVNVVDRPDLCDFIMPAIVDRTPVLAAVSSGGAAPLLTRHLKARLESAIPAAYGRLARFAGAQRDRVYKAIPDAGKRLRFWEAFLTGPVAEYLFSGQDRAAESLLDKMLTEAAEGADSPPVGEVYLVGAGPGDPDLLTFRALRLMQQTDVVLYDRLVGEGILNLVRRDATRIYVGKMKEDHTLPQEDISKLLVRLAKEGKRVLRLKAGDPFMFGRGGEEIEELAREGIAFQVIPGITAASGCASYAGIPLTHRDHAQSCVFVTGHGKDGKLGLNWQTLIQPNQTVVVYMGLSSLSEIAAAFIEHGADPATPAAVIEKGTREGQRVITGDLQNLPGKVAEAGLQSPALIIIGGVVTLRDNLSWFAGESIDQA
ncbi:MAG: uroporphyrinogen-III C-methyltransferase [Proteobacteria bacterium]|nr:uroporphyrinogen-III C-methyltransferase [Pseudomonadota bacterium]